MIARLPLILALLAATDLFAKDTAAPKLPPNVQSTLAACESAIARNRAAYDAANRQTFETAEKLLQAELDKLTRAGMLEDALRVKSVLVGLRYSMVAKVDEKANPKPTPTSATTAVSAPLVTPDPAPKGGSVRILKAVYGADASARNDVTDFIENQVKIGGLVRIPHATWVKDKTTDTDKLFVEIRDGKGEKRMLTFTKGHLLKPAEEIR